MTVTEIIVLAAASIAAIALTALGRGKRDWRDENAREYRRRLAKRQR